MKTPYGESNFKKIITHDFLYIDKTKYIGILEQSGSFNILLRPRRFGKTLFLSTLRHYYDILFKEEFETFFGHLAIGRNPTPLKNSYQILAFDFSGIETGSREQIEQGFNRRVETALKKFLRSYGYGPEIIQIIEEQNSPAGKIDHFFSAIGEANIYLLIDEYDHFANAVLGDSLELFTEIVGKGGFVRAFYEIIKIATSQGIVDRLLITGVTSITLDSMTSGFNIGDNITYRLDFNQAMGFTAQETEEMIQPLIDACALDKQEMMRTLGDWYNGYRFSSRADGKVFNPDMVLYFLRNFDMGECRFPEQMLDDNIASDYGKIMRLFGIGDRERNFETLEELIVNGEIIGRHKGKLDLDMHKPFERDDFISLLLYMGFITISGTVLSQLRYVIPNYVIQKLYYDYFRAEIKRRAQIGVSGRAVEHAVAELALHNNINPLLDEIRSVLALFSNRDFMRMDEKHIKAVILTLLNQSEVYFIRSEPEVNKRYPDILLLERKPIEVRYQFLFELKFSKKKDGQKGLEAKRIEGINQIRGYQGLADISRLLKLQSYLLLTDGTEIEAVAVV
ncbi:PD-(D/E)XK nuclease superfamily protein [Candidatus Electrothrix aarhusensis]|uniref:PD-(D/E)XK nuclease superfamily protein n=1 Tax=Candidatus Electrothrix aarhusensis TaxID=1859131 RepID=A0A3S3SHL7_9BACT|nr:PD-(D/E)XK nuclease superfamily protein [Candidatus Electrothrix aarhusensis]